MPRSLAFESRSSWGRDERVRIMTARSVYEKKPWLSSYPAGVTSEVEIPGLSLSESFDQVVKEFRKKTAVYFYGKKMSYQALGEKIDRLANDLSHIGLQKGDRCAILLLNSPEYIISFFALAKLGAVIVPVNPVYASSEIKYQLEDSGA